MFFEYIKLTLNKKNIFSFIKLNIFPSILEILNLFIFPLLIRQYYIIGQYEAIAINLSILFLFETLIVFISIHSFNIYMGKKKKSNRILSKALFFAFLKTTSFSFFLYAFKKVIKLNLYPALLFCFFSIFFFLCFFYLPCLLVKKDFISSLKESIYLYFSYPFFTAFVFLHSIILFFISMIFLGMYPGISKIMYNIHIALRTIEEKKSILKSENIITIH